jgi:hypothetical protein
MLDDAAAQSHVTQYTILDIRRATLAVHAARAWWNR